MPSVANRELIIYSWKEKKLMSAEWKKSKVKKLINKLLIKSMKTQTPEKQKERQMKGNEEEGKDEFQLCLLTKQEQGLL